MGEQRDRDVSAREPLAHDPGADDRREQESGSDAFRNDTTGEGGRHRMRFSRHARRATRRGGTGGASAARMASSRSGTTR